MTLGREEPTGEREKGRKTWAGKSFIVWNDYFQMWYLQSHSL